MNQSSLISRARLGVILSFLSHGFISSSFFARIPDYKARLELSNSVLGLCLLASSAGVLAALGPVGRLAAQRGSSAVLTKSSYLLVFIAPFVGISFNAISFAAILFLFGVAIAAQDVAMNTHGVTLEQKSGARFMGRFHAFWSVGALLGAITGGVFAQLEVSEFIHALIVSAAVLALVISNNRRYLPGDEDKHIYEESVKRKKTPRLIYIMGLLGLAGSIGEGSAADWGGVLARETFGASALMSALPYVFFSATMVIGRLSGDFLAHKFGVVKLLTWSGFISGIGLIAGLFAGNIYGVIVGWLLLGIGLSTVIPMMVSATGNLANEKYSGQVSAAEGVALVTGVAYFGFVIGPPLIGFISDHIELRWSMLLVVGLSYLMLFAGKYAKTN